MRYSRLSLAGAKELLRQRPEQRDRVSLESESLTIGPEGGQTRFEARDAAVPWRTPNPGVRSLSMPDDHAVQSWIRRNEAARAEDRRRDLERSMSERLEEAVRLSRIAAELETNLRREPDVRSG